MAIELRPRVLVAIDLEEDCEHVAAAAAALAARLGADVDLLHVSSRGFDSDREAAERHAQEAGARDQASLLTIADRLREQGLAVTTHLTPGAPEEVILDAARARRADYLVIGVHDHGLVYEAVVGSVARSLLVSSPCPVVAVPPPSGQGSSSGKG